MGRILCHLGHQPSVEQLHGVVFHDDARPNHLFVLLHAKAADRHPAGKRPAAKMVPDVWATEATF